MIFIAMKNINIIIPAPMDQVPSTHAICSHFGYTCVSAYVCTFSCRLHVIHVCAVLFSVGLADIL